jgi:hypothetical protein
MRKLLQMLSAVGMLVCCGQFDAFGSPHTFMEEDDTKQQQLNDPQQHLEEDVFKLVLTHCSSGTHPVDLQLVCKSWRNAMLEGKEPRPESQFWGLNPLMQQCLKLWWSEVFKNAVLHYTDPEDATKVIDLKFCDFLNRTFDLSNCRTTSNLLRMTQSVDEFLQVEGDNNIKFIILFAEREMIKRLINSSAKPFVKILAGWDPSYPFGIFWR